jgi:hypothetical protein
MCPFVDEKGRRVLTSVQVLEKARSIREMIFSRSTSTEPFHTPLRAGARSARSSPHRPARPGRRLPGTAAGALARAFGKFVTAFSANGLDPAGYFGSSQRTGRPGKNQRKGQANGRRSVASLPNNERRRRVRDRQRARSAAPPGRKQLTYCSIHHTHKQQTTFAKLCQCDH